MMFFTSDEIRRIENHLSAIRENPITEKQCNRCMAFKAKGMWLDVMP